MKSLLLILSTAFLFCSCARPEYSVTEIPEPLEEIQTQKAAERTDGSLWPGEQHSLFADHKARTVGDVVTITIAENASASKQASTSTDRNTSMSAAIPHLFGLENSNGRLNTQNLTSPTLLKQVLQTNLKVREQLSERKIWLPPSQLKLSMCTPMAT